MIDSGYRIDAPRPRPKRRDMQDTSTRSKIFIDNGCTAHLAIPCWYVEAHRPLPAEPHDRMRHDTLGWPTPDKPDSCCQEWDFDRWHGRRTPHMRCCPPEVKHLFDLGAAFPIHLKDEGYDEIQVTVIDSERSAPDGITATGKIDDQDDWIVRVSFDVLIPELVIPSEEPETYWYSVFASAEDRRDLVATGSLVVIPSPIGA